VTYCSIPRWPLNNVLVDDEAGGRAVSSTGPGPPATPQSEPGTASRPCPTRLTPPPPTRPQEGHPAPPPASGGQRRPRRHAGHRPAQHRSHHHTNQQKTDTPADPLTPARARE
jgi:hypothetical protein